MVFAHVRCVESNTYSLKSRRSFSGSWPAGIAPPSGACAPSSNAVGTAKPLPPESSWIATNTSTPTSPSPPGIATRPPARPGPPRVDRVARRATSASNAWSPKAYPVGRMAHMSRPITFLSDYGLRDEFVGVVHAVIATIAPEARVIDLSHGVPRQDVAAGARMLARSLPFAPAGVHLAVVDPEVGARRRAVALLTAEDERMLVGPDNGLLLPAADRFGGVAEAVEISASPWRLEPVSATFHGRDVFAPVAARLAAGEPLGRGGPAGRPRRPRADRADPRARGGMRARRTGGRDRRLRQPRARRAAARPQGHRHPARGPDRRPPRQPPRARRLRPHVRGRRARRAAALRGRRRVARRRRSTAATPPALLGAGRGDELRVERT